MRKFLKWMFFIGVALLAIFSPLLLIPTAAAVVGLSVGSRVLARKAGYDPDEGRVGIFKSLRRILENSIDRKLEQKSRSSEYNQLGFKITELPVDMKMEEGNARSAVFTCAGINGLVTARQTDAIFGLVKYSFPVHDAETASMLQMKASAMGNGARIYRNDTGDYTVEALDARSINTLAKAAYPMTKVDAVRQVDIVRQYRIDGCKNEDEAVKKFKAMIESGTVPRPDNYYQSESIQLDGVSKVVSDGSAFAMSPSSLPAGSYIVNETERLSCDIHANVPKDVSRKDYHSYMDSMGRSFDEDAERSEKFISGGTPLGISRTVEVNDRSVELVSWGQGLGDDARLFVVVKNQEQYDSAMKEGLAPEGADIYLGRKGQVQAGFGCLAFEMEATPQLLGVVCQEKAPVIGVNSVVSESDVKWSSLLDAYKRDGYVSLSKRDDISLEKSSVNGVDFGLVSERYDSARLPSLDVNGMSDWTADAGRLKNVSVTHDENTNAVRVFGRLDGSMVDQETVYVTPKQMQALVSRGDVSDAEKIDLFMQMGTGRESGIRPFKSYPSVGDSAIANPVVDYAKGSKPRTVGKVNKEFNQSAGAKKQKNVNNKL